MRYFGGKARTCKEIAKVLESYRKEGQDYLEPFVGAGWVICQMSGKRYGLDKHPHLIAMYQELQKGWEPPKEISKEEYKKAKEGEYESHLMGFVGFGCSFAGKWFGGYAKSKDRNYCLNAHNSVMKKMETMKDVIFKNADYLDLKPKGLLIYCDPPYQSTIQYSLVGDFDSEVFWETMREWSKNNTVLISEYQSPNDFEVVWEKQVKTDIRNSKNEKEKRTEKLFKFRGVTNDQPL